jgi:hypothetical protein
MKIWLDDVRPAPEGWTWVKSALDVIGHLQIDHVEEVSLDHDLGLDFLPGIYVLEWVEYELAIHGLEARIKSLPVFHIHSANPVGRKNMEAAIASIERMRNAS